MCRRVLGLGVTAVVIGGLCIASSTAFAADINKTAQAQGPSLSTGPGAQGLPLLPRGGGGDEIYAGNPTCIPNANSLQVGITGAFNQECADGQWVSLGYPVVTSGATIESINIIHNTNTGEGDLYLMGDCGNGPDTKNILWTGCSCIMGAVSGEVTNYCIGEPLVDPPAIVWVVAVFRDGSFAFDIAFDCNLDGPNHAFGNLVGSGNCGDWTDLDNFVVENNPCPGNPFGTFGGCAWVSLLVAGSPGVPPCCDSPAMCDGDVNGDGLVDPLDSGFVLARFGLDASDPANCQADANCDGLIDPLDSGYVLARFGLCNEPVECPLGGGNPGECGPVGCGEPSCPGPLNDCCEVHLDPGCDSVCGEPVGGEVEECVCVVDIFCCESEWDAACVEIVELFSCADCSDNNPDCDDGGGPANDDCEDAAPLEDGVTPFSTVGAITDGPAYTGACIEFGDDQCNQDIWYTYTAGCTGTVTVSTCNDANYDTRLAAYVGIGCPANNADIVGCNDDGAGCAGFSSILTFDANSGTDYLVRVGGFLDATGSGNLTVSCD
ncbi:MAG: hypothetical protein IH988_04855 [Planctomycetes bacterium]|nr:hypothetical protein [Planctomycetota bacterium]